MKAASEAHWESVITRYLMANGIPLKWDGRAKRFHGIAGHIFARLNPKAEQNVWAHMPKRMQKIGTTNDNVIMFVTNKMYGDSVDDSYVVMRLGTFIPMMKALVDSDKERWSNASHG